MAPVRNVISPLQVAPSLLLNTIPHGTTDHSFPPRAPDKGLYDRGRPISVQLEPSK
jgi:hypothetical protein